MAGSGRTGTKDWGNRRDYEAEYPITVQDIDGHKLVTRRPKNGKSTEVVINNNLEVAQ